MRTFTIIAFAAAVAATPVQAGIFGREQKAAPQVSEAAVAEIQRALDEQRLIDAGRMLDSAQVAGVRDPRLQVPRRAEPRTTVPAGAVALAGAFSGVYPRRSPGGWQLIGHTDAQLWDLDRPNPALLIPGMWVQFRAV